MDTVFRQQIKQAVATHRERQAMADGFKRMREAQTARGEVVVTKDQLEAQLCRDSLYDFFIRFWEVICPEQLVLNWHIKVLCDEIQTVLEDVFARRPKKYDLIENVSPGTTKSLINSVVAPAWCWTRDPTLRMICGSYSYKMPAEELADRFYELVTSDKYRRLFPEVVITKGALALLKNSKGGERCTTSTGSAITGFHAHAIFIDDPLNPKEAASDTLLKKANTWFDRTLMSRMVDKRVTPIILIMQRLHQNDPTAHMLERAATNPIRHICLPAVLSDKVRPRSMRRHYVDGLFDPVRLPQSVLTKLIPEMGEYAYAGQYGQDPIPAGGGMFRTDMIQMCHTPGRIVRMLRYWDKAGTANPTGKNKACFTVGVKLGVDADRCIWILDVVRGQWDAAQRERIILQTAQMDGKGVIIGVEQEPGSGGKDSAMMTVKNLMGFRVKLDRPVGDKVMRADPLAVQVNSGNVKMLIAPWNAVYLNEFQFFPFSTFKDQVDATSGGFGMLTRYKTSAGAF